MTDHLPPAPSGDPFAYDLFITDALRGVIRRVLETVIRHGLPGKHAIYITFLSGADGVEIPGYLRTRYPDEMTIVLEHKFSDLDVGDDAFGVTLSFGNVPARLRVPYAAILRFADSGAQFGLNFAPTAEAGAEGGPGVAAHPKSAGAPESVPNAKNHPENSASTENPDNVVALDRFRKS